MPMSYLVAVPEYVSAAATDLTNLGSNISAANAAAAGPTSQLLTAGADEVSVAVASLFSGHAQAFQALSAQAELFHQQFVQLLNAAGSSYAVAEAANASPLQTVQQDILGAINAPAQAVQNFEAAISVPAQTLLGGTSISGLTNLVSGGLHNLSIGGLTSIFSGGLHNLSIGGLTSIFSGGLTNMTSGAVTDILSGGLSNLTPAGLTNMVDGTLAALFPGGINIGGFNLLKLANVPYDLFANVVNIPYYESLALQEYAFALGPAGSVGGVPGWIPPGATVANGGVKLINGLPYYALGGTGSWYMESIGNTWGWDNGNWPQVDALLHFFLPFKFTEPLAEQLQLLAQAEIVDGAAVNSEFETANPLAYFGGWFHTPLSQLLSGYTYPAVLTDTIGQNSPTGIINVGPPGSTNLAIWSGQHVTLDPMAPLNAIGASLTGSPAENPIMLPNPANVIQSVVKLSNEINYLDFNPFVQGSFLYWGSPTLYSVPAAVGGIVQQFTGIPNQFLIPPWQPNGAEPITGYTTGLPDLVEGLPKGFEYLTKGLLGYVNPALPVDLSGPLDALGNLGVWPADVLRATGVADLWTLLTTNLPRAIADFDTQVGQDLASLVSTGSL
jgi:hypothetical protein